MTTDFHIEEGKEIHQFVVKIEDENGKMWRCSFSCACNRVGATIDRVVQNWKSFEIISERAN